VAYGGVVARQLYHPYGSVRYSEGTLPTDFGFTGQRQDGTGLVYMHARYYHPALGRFISADSVVPGAANPQAWNRYSYCANNPIRYVDPSGHQSGNPPQSSQISSSSVAAAQTLQSDTTVEYDPTAIQSWPPDVYLAASEAAALARQEARQARAERIQDNVALGINCFTLLVTGILGPGVAAYSTPAAGSVEASKGGYGGAYYPPGQVGMAATVDELDGINDGLDYGKAPGLALPEQTGTGPLGPELITQPLSAMEKDQYRAQARDIWQQATGKRAWWDGKVVHHRVPLEWAHLFPRVDPNRLANLVAMFPENHQLVNDAWTAFRVAHRVTPPTPAEVLRQAMETDMLYGQFMEAAY
jgi:RHS repeat-associated protein